MERPKTFDAACADFVNNSWVELPSWTQYFPARFVRFLLPQAALIPSREPCTLWNVPEAQVMDDFDNAANVTDSPEGLNPMFLPDVRRVSADIVAKFSVEGLPNSEPATMELVSRLTSIPVPAVRGFYDHTQDHYMVLAMEYVPGQTLERAWPKLSIWRKLWAIWTIRGYIHQLRRIRTHAPQIPGPAGPHAPAPCVGRFFGTSLRRHTGPFPTYKDLTSWFLGRMRLTLSKPFLPLTPSEAVPFDDSEPLVLVHGDINKRNIILGNDGRLWLIDWEWSGFYPRWFEYATMMSYTHFHASLQYTPSRLWDALIPFMAGYYREPARFVAQVGWALNTGLRSDPPPIEVGSTESSYMER